MDDAMIQDVLKAKWKQFRKELRYQWSQLSPDDIDHIDGKRDDLVSILERRYGFARGRAEKEVDTFVNEFEDKLRRAS
jgi:uncharacterized protein YjbJ (UPF0337 family)